MMKYNKNRIVYVFDLEGTISNCEHRKHLAPRAPFNDPNKSWNKFHAEFPKDEVNYAIYNIMQALWLQGNDLFILTGMMEKHKEMAKDWLRANSVGYDAIIMRQNDDFRTSPIFKIETARKTFDGLNRYNQLVLFDDREDIVDCFNNTKEFVYSNSHKMTLKAFKV